MADGSQENDATNVWGRFDPSLESWPLDPGFTLLDDDPAVYDPQLFDWNPQQTNSLADGLGSFGDSPFGVSMSMLDGTITPELATRSNTPGSDSSRHMPSPSARHSGLHTNAPTYRSRLPRRRSLYSRQGPTIRQSSLSRIPNSPARSPGLAQTYATSEPPIDPVLAQSSSLRRSDSTNSLGSECSNSSAYSTASASSATSTSRRSSSSRTRQKRTSKATPSSKQVDDRKYKCTFCCDDFRNRFDWKRHEKSLHLDLEVWKCAPVDGTLPSADGMGSRCAYCAALEPDLSHLESHNHTACVNRAAAARSFRRRDHLAQHLRVFHKLRDLPRIESWVDQGPVVASRCGFCNSQLATWEERTDHLAAHFRQGCTMKDWQGGHGFDETIEARLTNALPPYLLATEAKSFVPFSATSAESRDHWAQISARASGAFVDDATSTTAVEPTQLATSSSAADTVHTSALLDSRARSAEAFADILASHLARFALEYKQVGVSLSDEMLQREARQVLYSSDDPWNQTIADSPLWMKEFRDRNGLG